MVDRELALHIEGLEDEELVDMLTVSAGDYREDVLEVARSEARRRGLSFEEPEPEPEPEGQPGDEYDAAGQAIVCPHCGHERFEARELEWATALMCTKCSRLELFIQASRRSSD